MIGLFLAACGATPVDPPKPPEPATEHRPEPVIAAPAAPAAHGEHGGEPGHHEEKAEHAHGEHAEPAAEGPFVVPATLPEAVATLEQQRDQIQALVSAGKLAEIHPITERMMKVVVVLPVRAKDLPSDGKSAVTLAATELKKVLDALHHAADDSDAAATKTQLPALDAALAKLAPYKTSM